MSISTATGDDGTSCIITGERFPKDHPLFECLGTIDELNAFLGDAKAAIPAAENTQPGGLQEIINNIQNGLFTISGIIAGAKNAVPKADNLTALIHKLEANLPQMKAFAVPGVNQVSAKLHIARTVCRRTERVLVSLGALKIIPDETYSGILAWFNRLSDLLFLLTLQ